MSDSGFMLSDRDRLILETEDANPRYDRAKQDVIYGDVLRMNATRYYQRVMWLVKQPEVVAEFPQLASRVLRTTEQRTSLRAARRVA